MDPPEHTRYRRLLGHHFGPGRVEEVLPAIRTSTEIALDRMVHDGPPVDLVASFAVPVPALVICELLGIPPEDRHEIQAATAVMNDLDSTPAQAAAAVGSIMETIRGLIPRLRSQTGAADVGLLAQAASTGDLTDEELTNLGMVLVATGHLPTASMLGLAAFVLLTNPVQRGQFGDAAGVEPAGDGGIASGTERAVDELLRYLSI